jgi:hypothetical protein
LVGTPLSNTAEVVVGIEEFCATATAAKRRARNMIEPEEEPISL